MITDRKHRARLACLSSFTAAVAALALVQAQAQTGGDGAGGAEPAWLTAVRAGRVHRSRDGGEVYGMGAVPASAAALARSAHFVVRAWGESEGGNGAARPSSLVLTDYLPPVQMQGQQGSCVAWSAAYYCYTYAVSKQRQLGADRIAENKRLQFSPAYIYHLGDKGRDHGMSVTTAFEILKEQGCASLEEMPYDPADYLSPPSDAANVHAARFKARDSGVLFGLGEAEPEKLKTYLAEARQPFVAEIPILADFPKHGVASDYVYRPAFTPSPANITGLHAITIVGYDDAKHAFRLVNSWGTKWGDQGFLWVDEDFIHACALDGCSIVAGGIVARDPSSGVVRVGPHVSLLAAMPASGSGTIQRRPR